MLPSYQLSTRAGSQWITAHMLRIEASMPANCDPDLLVNFLYKATEIGLGVLFGMAP